MKQRRESHWREFGFAGLPLLAFVLLILGLRFGFSWNLSDAIYLATGLVVIFYTIETWKMRCQMVRQNEIAIQPLLITGIEKVITEENSDHSYYQVVLRNIGKGPALFVQVKDIEIVTKQGMRLMAKFDPVDHVEAGKDARTHAKLVEVGTGRELFGRWDFGPNLDPRWANETYDVSISYEDVISEKHLSIVRMGKDGIRLLWHGRGGKM